MNRQTSFRRLARITGSVLGPVSVGCALLFIGFIYGGTVSNGMGNNNVTLLFRNAAILSTIYYPQFQSEPLGIYWNRPYTPLSDDGPVTRHDPDRSQAGTNLLVAADGMKADLVSMTGEVLHSWSRSFEEVWPDPNHVPDFRPDLNISWRRVHLYPNGDILVVYSSPDLTPYGLGLVKLDKDSNVVWRFSGNVHHDIAVDPDGRIYVPIQEIATKRYNTHVSFQTPYLGEGVAVLDENGNLVRKVQLLDAIIRSDRRSLMSTLFLKSLQGDFIHLNTVQYIDADLAKRFPFAKAGQLLLSMREMNTIAILDMETEQIVWSMAGLFHRQHEPQLLPNGNILIYDNRGHGEASEGPTRILEFDPLTQAVVWKYAGTVEDPLSNPAWGSQQRLPNGNTMIVDSINGRVLEVTPNKDVVWQYRVTARRTHEGATYIPVITDMVRFPPGTLDFLEETRPSG
jgi:hypothetical protein